jgi:ketosteroid isomerase-like protein
MEGKETSMRKISLWLLAAALLAIPVVAQEKAKPRPTSPTKVASAYLDAMDTADLDRAESLFAKESSIFEGGGEEGTWKHYREHHIGPELAEFSSFKTTKGMPEEEVSADGSMAFVAWPVEYRIVLKDGKAVDSQGTVTFVLVRESDAYRIRHLHWSSRKKK